MIHRKKIKPEYGIWLLDKITFIFANDYFTVSLLDRLVFHFFRVLVHFSPSVILYHGLNSVYSC